jgi:hypothetical protein
MASVEPPLYASGTAAIVAAFPTAAAVCWRMRSCAACGMAFRGIVIARFFACGAAPPALASVSASSATEPNRSAGFNESARVRAPSNAGVMFAPISRARADGGTRAAAISCCNAARSGEAPWHDRQYDRPVAA